MISSFFRSSRVAAEERRLGNRNVPTTNQNVVRLMRSRFIILSILTDLISPCRESNVLLAFGLQGKRAAYRRQLTGKESCPVKSESHRFSEAPRDRGYELLNFPSKGIAK